VLVDNAPPRVSKLSVAGRTLRGEVVDADSNVVRVEYAVDGGEWQLVFPRDDLFDDETEAFEVVLADDVPRGRHIVAIRAFDEGGNQVAAQTIADLPAAPGRTQPGKAPRGKAQGRGRGR